MNTCLDHIVHAITHTQTAPEHDFGSVEVLLCSVFSANRILHTMGVFFFFSAKEKPKNIPVLRTSKGGGPLLSSFFSNKRYTALGPASREGIIFDFFHHTITEGGEIGFLIKEIGNASVGTFLLLFFLLFS